MPDRPTLILDVMGAERGIAEMVHGVVEACKAPFPSPTQLVLVTNEMEHTRQLVGQELAAVAAQHDCAVELIPATQTLPENFTSPVDVFKKHPQCSIRVAMDHAKQTPASAVVSLGTTGLVMTSALFTLGRVKGIARPPIGTPMPTRGKQLFFVDGGSNVDNRPEHLYQFAVLAHLYVKNVYKVPRPAIALLSNGSEEYKGNAVVREAASLISADQDLNFVGFTEGHTLFKGDLDIMVCDGFIGNILLKFAEGAADMIISFLKEEIKNSLLSRLAAKIFQRRALRQFAHRLDYTYFGGAPLLGLNGNVVICHGRSPANAIKYALLVGHELARSDIAKQVAQYMEAHPLVVNGGNSGS